MKRLLSALVISGILSAALAGCAASQEVASTSVESSNSSESTSVTSEDSSGSGTTGPSDSTSTGATQQSDANAAIPYTKSSNGTYSYDVVGFIVKMKTDVNDYIVSDGEYTCFDFWKLAVDCGWTVKDGYAEEIAYGSDGGQITLMCTGDEGGDYCPFISEVEAITEYGGGSICQYRCRQYQFRLYQHHTLQISPEMIVLTAFALEKAETYRGYFYEQIFGEHYLTSNACWIPAA